MWRRSARAPLPGAVRGAAQRGRRQGLQAQRAVAGLQIGGGEGRRAVQARRVHRCVALSGQARSGLHDTVSFRGCSTRGRAMCL